LLQYWIESQRFSSILNWMRSFGLHLAKSASATHRAAILPLSLRCPFQAKLAPLREFPHRSFDVRITSVFGRVAQGFCCINLPSSLHLLALSSSNTLSTSFRFRSLYVSFSVVQKLSRLLAHLPPINLQLNLHRFTGILFLCSARRVVPTDIPLEDSDYLLLLLLLATTY